MKDKILELLYGNISTVEKAKLLEEILVEERNKAIDELVARVKKRGLLGHDLSIVETEVEELKNGS